MDKYEVLETIIFRWTNFLSGFTEIVDGLTRVLTFGYFGTYFTMKLLVKSTIWQCRLRMKAKKEA